jgi:hypothetical protein
MTQFEKLMLELNTGDASPEDRYIQEAMGQIAIATTIFDVAAKAAEAHELGFGKESLIVQEAVAVGGSLALIQEAEGAAEVAGESVKQSLVSFLSQITTTAKKIEAAANKDITVLNAYAKANGVAPTKENYVTKFAKPLAGTVKGSLSTSENAVFLRGPSALSLATQFGEVMANFLAAYGIDISDVFGDSVLSNVFGRSFTVKPVSDIMGIRRTMNAGGNAAKRKGGKTTSKIKGGDLTDYALAVYSLITIASAVSSAAGGGKAEAVNRLVGILNTDTGKKDKKISSVNTMLNEGVKAWSTDLNAMADNIVKQFGDSAAALASASSSKS